MTQHTKQFPTEILLSITTGYVLHDNFNDIEEAAEYILGEPLLNIWRYFPKITDKITKSLLAQHPDLLPEYANDITPENCKEKTQQLLLKLGTHRTVTKGQPA